MRISGLSLGKPIRATVLLSKAMGDVNGEEIQGLFVVQFLFVSGMGFVLLQESHIGSFR